MERGAFDGRLPRVQSGSGRDALHFINFRGLQSSEGARGLDNKV